MEYSLLLEEADKVWKSTRWKETLIEMRNETHLDLKSSEHRISK